MYVFWHGNPSGDGRVMAAVLAGGRGAAAGIVFHRATLSPDELSPLRGIGVTTIARTLLDLASVLPRQRLETALTEAEYRGLTDLVPS